MRRITGFVFLLAALNGFDGLSSALAAAEPFSCAPSFAKASPYAKPLRRDKSAGGQDRRAPGAMLSSARVPFVANEGQIANPEVKYYAKTFGGTVYALADGTIVYSLPKYDAASRTGSRSSSGSVILQERLHGSYAAEPLGAGKSPVAVSSFIGDRPEKWRVNLPAFDRLDFGEVYEGVSLLLAARGNNVEKIFVLSPGADPRAIALGFEGASNIEITPDGKLELQTAFGAVYFTRPVAWQIDAQGKSLPVTADYVLDEDGQIRFELSSYDPDNVLVIDPLLASTFVGGGGGDTVQAMAVDSRTNVYVAGYTDSSDFPTTNNPYRSVLAGGQDAFVSRFDANLGTLAASTYIGGSSNDQATAIGIDAGSRIWIAGYTESANFPTNSSSMNPSYSGNGDAFVAILASNLDSLVGATYLGGSNIDYAAAIAMDNSSRRQYIVGYTESADFPATNINGYATNYNGARDAFVALFSNDVTRADYKTGIFLGGTNADEAAAAVVSPGTASTNSLYVVGFTSSTNFPGTNGHQRVYGGGANDAFVCRLSALLTNLPTATFLGGSGSDLAYAIGLDVSNRLYVAGSTTSTNFPQNPTNNIYLAGWTNAYQGGQDIFVACFTNNSSNLYASTYIGGTNDDVAKCLVVDSSRTTNLIYVYVAGYTTSSNFPTTPNAYDRSYNGGEDAFTLRLDGPLTNMYASTYLGGGANDRALALALTPASNELFVAGITASSDFPASDAAYETAFRGGASDGFVTKFPAALAYGTLKWKKFINGICSSPALTWDGTVIVGVSTALIAYTRSGVQSWQVVTTSAVAEQAYPLEGLGVPAVGTNNIIYVNATSRVYSISSAGAVNWIFNSGQQVSFWSAITFNNEGNLFFGQGTRLYSINNNGTGIWTNSLEGFSDPAPVVNSNGIIYAVSSDPGWLYDFNSSGSSNRFWTTIGKIYASPAVNTNGNIYVGSSNRFYAFQPGGSTARVWTAADQIYSSPAISTNGVVYVGGGNDLYAFNPNGTTARVWNVGNEVKSSPAIAADGSIIVGAANTNIYSFNPDGTTNWVFSSDDEFQLQSPLIDSEGVIYVSDNSSIYALYGSAPPVESGWPMFRHDALRTGNQGLNVASSLRPTGLAVSKGTITNYVRAGWNISANALNYELWRSPTNSTATASRIRRLTQTNYNDSSLEPGKIYYYWVKVKTPVALSAFSASDAGGIPPFPPAGVTASDGVPTNYVQVTWQVSTNATTYYVYRSLNNNPDTAGDPIGTTSSTNYDDYTVAPGLRHYYWIKAGNAEAGISSFSSSNSGGIPCWPPSGLSASAYVRSVALSWNISTGASSYIIYRNTENDSSTAGIIITNVVGLGTNDVSGTPMRNYYYWVRATNEYGYGLSGFGAPVIGWSLLAPPQAVYASAGAYSNMIRVAWGAGSTDATAHVIFRSSSSDVSSAVRQSEVAYNFSTDTNYDDTAITRGLDYYYWVAARNIYGSSTWTAASAPGGTTPATPSDLNASDGTYSNMVKVTWTHSPGSTYYAVYRYETFDSSYATYIGSAPTNYYDDSSAAHGVLYYYWVKAGNNYGLSPLTTFNSGWRGMVPPDNVTAGYGISTSEVSVTWSAAPDALSYELWRGTNDQAASARRLVNNIAATSYSDQSANPGTAYYYWLKSKRGTYVSAFSAYDLGYRAIGLLDIGVSDFVFVPTVFGPLAHPAAVSFKVSNLSAIDMVEPNNTVQYDLYLSSNAVFGGGDDYWIGSSNATLTLNASASTRVVCPASARSSITIPEWASGSYYVFVFVNHCLPSGWLDPNLANNEALRLGSSITIASATALQPVWNDYDGDGKTDLAVYQEASGGWRFWLSTFSYTLMDLTGAGGAGYRAIPRDYDGDGKVDPAVYQESIGTWRVCLSASGYQPIVADGLGGTGQYAVPADYDGDGRADPAVYQSSTGVWRVWLSASGYAEAQASGMGGTSWWPVPADYDGDGKTDPAVYEETTGGWRIWLSGASYQEACVVNWGVSGQRPVPADYDGDGRVDPAVYQESATSTGSTSSPQAGTPARNGYAIGVAGGWRIWLSGGSYYENTVAGWGGEGQTAVPGDYDGDGRVDPVVFWESMGLWRFWLSSYRYSEIDILEPGGIGFHAITAGE